MALSILSSAALVGLVSTASALPTDNILAPRGAPMTFGDWTGNTSTYGSAGTYVKSYDPYHYASGEKCWTDLWYVNMTAVAESWVQAAVTVDCATTSNCASGQINATQSCSDWSIAATVGFDLSIEKDVLGVSGSVTATEGGSQCTTATSSTTCTWADSACHALWTSSTTWLYHTYINRRCNTGGMDQTVWSKDIDMNQPAPQTRLGCGAFCNMTSYPGSVPAAIQPGGSAAPVRLV